MFTLDPRLQNDTILLGHFQLCLLLLMNDCTYPWMILVPRHPDIREIYELPPLDRQQLLNESCCLAEALTIQFKPDKLNVAALGNMVPQLHLHHVVRYRTDPAWPAPVWGKFPANPYRPEQVAALRGQLLPRLSEFTASPD